MGAGKVDRRTTRGRMWVVGLVALALLASVFGIATPLAGAQDASSPDPSVEEPAPPASVEPAPATTPPADALGGVFSGPVDLPPRSVAAGDDHSCAITQMGSVDCWGVNDGGQAADQSDTTYTAVAAGSAHTCALTGTGAVNCWGNNGYGQAADQSDTTYTAVSAGLAHTCALTAAGSVNCWGNNGFGQSVDQSGATYTAVSVGEGHSCALTAAGAVDCWGDNVSGQAADRSDTTYTAIAAGGHHTCALTAAGTVHCWGENSTGQATDQLGGTYVAIGVGFRHSCAVTTAGGLDCWGDNFRLQAPDLSAPIYQSVDGGREHSCALTVTGAVDCFGSDLHGQADDRPAPTLVAAGGHHTCAWTAGGGAECWGLATSGQSDDQPPAGIGALTAGEVHSCALTVSGGADCWGDDEYGRAADQAGPYKMVSAGLGHTCALEADDSIDCWGANNAGQAADTPVEGPGSYTQVSAGGVHTCAVTESGEIDCWGSPGATGAPAGPDFVSVDAGGSHTCAVTDEGAVQCWGSNIFGQATSQGPGGYVKVEAGFSHTCALTRAGAVDCWGSNGNGQATDQAGPYRDLAAGYFHSCALTDAGQVHCWGNDTNGQLGGVPAVVSAPPPAATVGAAYSHQFEVDPADVSFAWDVDGVMPPGLAFDAETGLVSGTPTEAGSYDLDISATNLFGTSVHEVTLEVEAASTFGYLRATTSPAVPATISVDGEPRDSWGLNWLPVPLGQHEVCFGAVNGFSPPPCQVVEVTPGATTEVVGEYAQRGQLRVMTNPAVKSTIMIGNDLVHRNDWGLWTEVDPGTYTVCFSIVDGYDPPPCEQVEVTAGETTTLTGDFTPNPAMEVPDVVGYLRAYTDPAVASRITINGNWADSWGLTWMRLYPGEYEVCFEAVLYADAPPCQDVVITVGNTTEVVGDFTVHGFVKVTTSPALPAVVSIDGVDRNVWGVWTSIAPGQHEVCFKAVEGFTAPACQQVAVTAGQTTEVSGVYTPL